jgi:hypothetical protein
VLDVPRCLTEVCCLFSPLIGAFFFPLSGMGENLLVSPLAKLVLVGGD